MLVFSIVFAGCYAAGLEGVVVEVPFTPSEVLQVLVGLYGHREVKAPLDVPKRVLVGVTLMAPLEVL